MMDSLGLVLLFQRSLTPALKNDPGISLNNAADFRKSIGPKDFGVDHVHLAV
jgi:hypothetical protein